MFVLYVVAYLDRINVGFAALQMRQDLGFTDTVYGLGAGIFFIGYFLFEVPSNLIMHRVGARVWMARIMISWGVISAATMLVRGAPAARAGRHRYSVRQALAHGRVWLLALLYSALVCGLYGVSFWIPQIIRGFGGLGDFAVGVVSMVPYLAAAIGMVVVGAHSDRRQERRWHLAGPAFIGAAGLLVSGSVMAPIVSLLALSLGALGMWSALGPFWARSATFASGSAAAGAIALVNSVGNLGGFLGPYLVGLVKEHTDGFAGGLALLAGWLVLAGVIALGLRDEAALPS